MTDVVADPQAPVLCACCGVKPPTLPEHDQLCDGCRNMRALQAQWLTAPRRLDPVAEALFNRQPQPRVVVPARDTPGCTHRRFERLPSARAVVKCLRCGYVKELDRDSGLGR